MAFDFIINPVVTMQLANQTLQRRSYPPASHRKCSLLTLLQFDPYLLGEFPLKYHAKVIVINRKATIT